MFFSLLEGHLFADSVGLISHTVFDISSGIYERILFLRMVKGVL
jgi:hypothetical protein